LSAVVLKNILNVTGWIEDFVFIRTRTFRLPSRSRWELRSSALLYNE